MRNWMKSRCWVLLQFCCSRTLMLAMLFSNCSVSIFLPQSLSSFSWVCFQLSFIVFSLEFLAEYHSYLPSPYSSKDRLTPALCFVLCTVCGSYVNPLKRPTCVSLYQVASWFCTHYWVAVADSSKGKPVGCVDGSTGFIKTSCFRETAGSC